LNAITRSRLRVLLPIAVLALAIVGAITMIRAHPTVQTRPHEVLPPLVRVLTVHTRDLQLSVHTQGTVVPRTESTLVPEVTGRVISVSPALVDGGFFETQDVLLEIDATDYQAAVVRTRARVAQQQLNLARAEQEATIARSDWDALGQGPAKPLAAHEPQLANARAALAAARAELALAERDLARTRVRAPFAGRVRHENVDIGQYVMRGVAVATIYAVDAAEVRLPLPDEQLAYIDLPLDYRGADADPSAAAPDVMLRATFAGQRHVWNGKVVRTEGELDPRSRMVHVIARVDDPYGRGDDPGRPPLAVGMFVEAEIIGRHVPDVVVIPRAALRGRDQVLVIEEDTTLRFRTVDILKADRESAILRGGLTDGERICLSPLDAVVDGMQVRTVEADAPADFPAAGRLLVEPTGGNGTSS